MARNNGLSAAELMAVTCAEGNRFTIQKKEDPSR
jgi:hypothetical protein